jgi:NDP-sugar pyrophosphorylase family protein
MKKGLFGLIVVLLFLSFFSLARAENKNVVEIGGDVTIAEGQKIKNVVAVGGQITVNGTVTGHVVAIGRSVVLTRSALVEGNVISVG